MSGKPNKKGKREKTCTEKLTMMQGWESVSILEPFMLLRLMKMQCLIHKLSVS